MSSKGFISPAKFIPVAEETGLIVPLGKWVFQEACQQLRIWQQLIESSAGNLALVPGNLTMSVNLSGKQLSQLNLIEQIDQILAETGCDARYLKLEITESVIMENKTLATEMLSQLKARNIKISIDDFGTGYSSLSYLHQFPIDILKVDRSFVSRLGQECLSLHDRGEPLQIVRAIVMLAHNLGLEVVAEGIETRKQLQELRHLGCEYGQGYLFAQALPASAVIPFLETFQANFLEVADGAGDDAMLTTESHNR